VWVSCLEELVYSQRHHLRTYCALFTWRKRRFWVAKLHYLWTRMSYAQRLCLNSHLWLKAIKTAVYIKNRSSTWVLNMTLYEAWTGNVSDLSSLHVFSIIAWAHIFKEWHQQEVKFEDCSLKCHYLGMKESSIFRVWDSESEQVLESHNCFVDEGITAYENIANIEVTARRRQLALAIMLSTFLLRPHSCCHNLLLFQRVSAPATLLLWFLLLQRSNSSSSFVSEKASTSSRCQFLMKTEYMAETQATKKAIWLRRFLSEIGYFHDNNKAMNLARNPEFHACIITYNITLFVKLLIVTLSTLNLYLLLSKQQMSLLRLCLLSSLAVFLFRQVLYLINDLSSTHVWTLLLLTFFVAFTFSLSYLTVAASLRPHHLAVELTFSEIEELYTG
jgi:hypothetical protein